MAPRRVGHFITRKILGIDVNERYANQPPNLDSRARDILEPADIYLEDEPTVAEWMKELVPDRSDASDFVRTLFPSASWIRRYNVRWLLGDAVAGITVGLVVVPQAMAYAVLANLTPAYGLYTSFTGAILYWMFGTSKDIVIGATAVGSLLVGQVVDRVNEKAPDQFTAEQTAHALSILAGAVLLFFGLFRLGWIIEFIPYIPISAFITAAGITIMSTQIPTLLGIPDVKSRDPPYRVLINTLKGFPNIHLDAAIGLSSIVLLFAIREFCSRMEVRRPHQKRTWSFLSSLRLTFTMLFFTLISYLVNRNLPHENSKFRIVGPIERGFQRANIPHPDIDLVKLILPELPAVAMLLVIEHIAIAKAMGRLYNYTINPSQEIVALGSANMFSPFVGGYVCTGSFGASAVLSKSGVRTPLTGLFSALVLVLALYALTGVFYYIPNAALSGLIIHAVCNLLTPPKNLYKYWQLSPFELVIWIVGVALALFVSLEVSIYTGIILSVLLLLYRLARTKGQFLGQVRARRVAEENSHGGGGSGQDSGVLSLNEKELGRDIYLPLDRNDASNPDLAVASPYPGVFVYRVSEGYNYTNQAFHVETLLSHVMEHTRQMSEDQFEQESDRMWNDAGPRHRKNESNTEFPFLRAIVFDFSAVNNVDITSIQGMVDLRNSLDHHSAPDTVEWHFANVQNRWTRRALAAAGFGYPTFKNTKALRNWKPVYSLAATLGKDEERTVVGWDEEQTPGTTTPVSGDVFADEREIRPARCETPPDRKMAALYAVDRPFFHADLHDAVDSAVRDAKSKDRARTYEGTPPLQ